MPVKWTAETHDALLAAIVGSGLLSSLGGGRAKAIIDAWPKSVGPAPTVSALTQHLEALRKKHKVTAVKSRSLGSAASAPARAAPASRGRGGQSAASGSRDTSGKSGNKAKATAIDSSGDEDDEVIMKLEAKPKSISSRGSQPTGSHNNRLPRATLSPSTGLKEKTQSPRKRKRDDSPMDAIPERLHAFSSHSDSGDNDDPLEDLPMGMRLEAQRKKRQEEWLKYSYA